MVRAAGDDGWPVGGGEMGALIRAHDWAATPLGPSAGWPQSLRTAVELLVASRQPTYIAWGEALTSIYNDGYIPILEDRHPAGLGQPYPALFAEIWDEYRPIVAATFAGEAQYFEDRPVALRGLPGRSFTFSWTPLRDDTGRVGGFYCAATETTAHARAEAALRASEARYRALFTEMDEAYAVVDVIADGAGRWHDFRFVEVNPAFVRHTGIPYPVGQTATALLGASNPRWAELYGRAVDTGEAVRVEESELTLGRTFDLNIFRLGGPGSRRVAVLFADVTERKRREADREFLLDLTGALGEVADERETVRVAGERLVASLGLACYHYVDVDEGRGEATVRHFWHAEDVPPILGTYPLAGFITPRGRASLRAGVPSVFNDLEHDLPGDTPAAAAQRAGAAAQRIASHVTVPYSRDGRWTAYFAAADSRPRHWTDREIALIQEVAARLFPRVERARAEERLRASEARLRLATEAADLYAWDHDLRANTTVFSDNTARIIGAPAPTTPVEITAYTHPDDRPRVAALGRRALAEGLDHFEYEFRSVAAPGEERQFQVWCAIIRDAAGVPLRTVGISQDITARQRREANLAFLAEVSQDLARLPDIDETMEALGAKLAARFGLSACAFAELQDEAQIGVINHGWHRADMPSLLGTYRMAEFVSPEVLRLCRAGEAVVIRDVFADPRTDGARYAALHIGAFVAMPLVRDGEWRFLLVAYRSEPHDWREDEVALLRELTDRIWARLERARIEVALRASEARFRDFADASADTLWIVDGATGRIEYLSPSFEAMFGAPRAAGLAQSGHWDEQMHPDDRDAGTAILPLALAGEVAVAEYRIVRADTGEVRWLRDTAFPIRDADGVVRRAGGIAQDLTARHRAEAALRESEERARALVANLPGGAAFIVDRDLRYRLAEGEALRAAGLAPEDFRGKAIAEVANPVQAAQQAADYRRALAGVAFIAEHGEDGRTYLTRGVPLRGADGKVDAVLALSFDISDRKRAEAALRESEDRFRSVANLVPDLLWQSEPDGATTWYNDRWLEYTGQTFDEAIGWGWTEAIHPEDRAASVRRYREAIAARTPLRQEHRIRRHDGAYRWFLVRAEPLPDAAGGALHMYGAATDIQEARAARDELEAQVAARTAELRALSRQLLDVRETEQRHLSRELHDEIGQLLTGLQLTLAALPLGSDPAATLARARGLVDDLLARVRGLTLDLRPPALDDLGLLAALRDFLRRYTAQSGIRADLRHEGLERRLDAAAETAAYRIVQEALTNTARHAAAAAALVQLVAAEGWLTVQVRDDGQGFDPDAALAARASAGLAGMRERAELLGGTLTIESDPGSGTIITAELPLDSPAADRPGAGDPQEAP